MTLSENEFDSPAIGQAFAVHPTDEPPVPKAGPREMESGSGGAHGATRSRT